MKSSGQQPWELSLGDGDTGWFLPNSVNSQPQPLLSGPSDGEMLSGQHPRGKDQNRERKRQILLHHVMILLFCF